jgi:hypothetical protein
LTTNAKIGDAISGYKTSGKLIDQLCGNVGTKKIPLLTRIYLLLWLSLGLVGLLTQSMHAHFHIHNLGHEDPNMWEIGKHLHVNPGTPSGGPSHQQQTPSATSRGHIQVPELIDSLMSFKSFGSLPSLLRLFGHESVKLGVGQSRTRISTKPLRL